MSDEQATRTHPSLTRHQLRLALREQRKAVPKSVALHAANAIARHLARRIIKKGQRIAVYAAIDGEIDLSPVIRQAQRVGCVVYAPHIVNMRARRMEFVECTRATSGCYSDGHKPLSISVSRNQPHRRIDPRRLDVVLLPLVAFDANGWRLGFGAGFYDRKFSFLRRQFVTRPILIGVGYEFQRVPPQIPNTWDVLLNAVVTEHGLRQCHSLHIQ
jgi:5-formyltetrahydrofolate cyclo-ligase